ncbi:MAG: protein kinase [Myxococcota bacterium]|nr:protein kinase [Myxococcota bacterium]
MSIYPAPNVVIAARFRLNRLLGRGGMGSVWHATHLGLDIPCAVKFIEGEGAHLPEVQARFEREAKAAAQLRSPHVVQILDHGVCDGTPYIAMELLEGEDLGKRLARVGRMSPHELVPVVAQVGRALSRAHAVGIVHRDLKPENIFLVPDDDREIAKVLDFGIAKAPGASVLGASTKTGAMLGTPYYMSPEQAQGIKALDARSDLWSLAVIVFEALTAQRPFQSEALGDLLMKIIVAPIPLPSHVAPDLPPGVDAWWVRASQRDPAHRFQSAKEFCEHLTLALGRSEGEVAGSADQPPAPKAPLAVHPSGVAPTPEPPPGASTGSPIAHTFGGRPPGVAGRTVPVVAVGGALVVLTAGVLGVSYVVKGNGQVAPAAVLSSASTMVDAMASLPPVYQTATTARLTAPPEAVASTTVAPGASAAPQPVPSAKPAHVVNPPAAVRSPSAASAPPAVKPPPPLPEGTKKPIDLGI